MPGSPPINTTDPMHDPPPNTRSNSFNPRGMRARFLRSETSVMWVIVGSPVHNLDNADDLQFGSFLPRSYSMRCN